MSVFDEYRDVPAIRRPRLDARQVVEHCASGLLTSTDELDAAVAVWRAAAESYATAVAGGVEERAAALTAAAREDVLAGRALSAKQLAQWSSAFAEDAAATRVLAQLRELLTNAAGQVDVAARSGVDGFVEQLRAGPVATLRARWEQAAAELDGLDPRDAAPFVVSGRAGDRARALRDSVVELAGQVDELRRVHRQLLGMRADAGELGDLDRAGVLGPVPVEGDRLDALDRLVLGGVSGFLTLAEARQQTRPATGLHVAPSAAKGTRSGDRFEPLDGETAARLLSRT